MNQKVNELDKNVSASASGEDVDGDLVGSNKVTYTKTGHGPLEYGISVSLILATVGAMIFLLRAPDRQLDRDKEILILIERALNKELVDPVQNKNLDRLLAPKSPSHIKPENCSPVVRGDNAVISIICGEIEIAPSIDVDEFEARLTKRKEELRKQVNILKAAVDDVPSLEGELRLKQFALKDAENQLKDIPNSFKRQVALKEELSREIEALSADAKTGITNSDFDAAATALREGRFEVADDLLREIQVQPHSDISQQAKISFERGRIAELENKDDEAARHYIRAAQLNPKVPDYLLKAQTFATEAGNYDIATRFAEDLLQFSNVDNGASSLKTAIALTNLAGLYVEQGRYGDAEPLYRRGLEIAERILGTDHPQTTTSLNNLARVYQAQGLYDEAQHLYQRSIDSRRRLLGPDHPSLVIPLNNLAGLYAAQVNYGAAEQMYEQALAISERANGNRHPATIAIVENYLRLLRKTAKTPARESRINKLSEVLKELDE